MNDFLTTVLGVVWGVGALLCLWFAIEVLRSRRQEQAMVAWPLLFALTPPVGAALCPVFGARKLRQKAERKPKPAERPAGSATSRAIAWSGGMNLSEAYRSPPCRVAARG